VGFFADHKRATESINGCGFCGKPQDDLERGETLLCQLIEMRLTGKKFSAHWDK
jgi:hypothetical protein